MVMGLFNNIKYNLGSVHENLTHPTLKMLQLIQRTKQSTMCSRDSQARQQSGWERYVTRLLPVSRRVFVSVLSTPVTK